MNENELAYYAIKGMIDSMPDNEKILIKTAIQGIKAAQGSITDESFALALASAGYEFAMRIEKGAHIVPQSGRKYDA